MAKVKWYRYKKFNFMRYECDGVLICEGYRNIVVPTGWGKGRRNRQQKYWRIIDERNNYATVGDTEGYVLLREAKEVAEEYLNNK